MVVEAVSPEASTLPNRPTDSVYGLGDTVLDTPRSIYEVSKDQLQYDALNSVNDLARYSPSVTASSGQGIAGAPYIRGSASGASFGPGIRTPPTKALIS
jgi:iron complex outermembrane receptor protein